MDTRWKWTSNDSVNCASSARFVCSLVWIWSSRSATKAGTWSDYYNPEVETLVERGSAETDPVKRDEIFKRIGRILHDDGHAVLLSELYYTFAQDSGLNWTPQYGSGYYNLRNISWK